MNIMPLEDTSTLHLLISYTQWWWWWWWWWW